MYPSRGNPLLPTVLRPLLADHRIDPVFLARHSLPSGITLGEVDEKLLAEVRHETAQALADYTARLLTPLMRGLRQSPILINVDPTLPDLSIRALNGLKRAGVTESVRRPVTLGKLASTQQIGVKTLLEILLAGECQGRQEQSTRVSRSRRINRMARRLKRRRWAHKVTNTDLRLGALVRQLSPLATNARMAAEFMSKISLSRSAADEKVAVLRELLAAGDRLAGYTLVQEFEDVLTTLVLRSNARRALTARFGLAGDPPITLEAAGILVGISRERVRQVEEKLLQRIENRAIWTPALDRALDGLATMLPTTTAEWQSYLYQVALVTMPFSIPSLLSAAGLFGKELAVAYDSAHAILVPNSLADVPRVMARTARSLIARWGVSTMDEISARIDSGSETAIPEKLLTLVVESLPGFTWLDKDDGWFWVRGTTRNALITQIKKIMSVAGSITLGELREGVGRPHRMTGFRPPRVILATVCKQLGYKVVDNLVLEYAGLPPWQQVLAPGERELAEILFENGPIMRRDDLEKDAIDGKRLTFSAFQHYMTYSPIIARYAPSVYGLRGARVSAAEVKAMIPRRVKARVLVDHGWTTDGQAWIAYKLSNACIASGVVPVPGAIKSVVQGSYTMGNDKRSTAILTFKDHSAWGFAPTLRRLGAEADDFVLIVLNLSTRKARISLGTEELVARYQDAAI